MLTGQELQNLKRELENVWSELQTYQYEVIEPRFYKEKRGRRMELVNPWKTVKERNEAEEKGVALFWKHNKLLIQYWQETGEHFPVTLHFRRQDTPSGDRWVRRKDL